MRSAALAAAAGAVLCGSTLQFLQPPLLRCTDSACDRRRSTAESRVLYCLHCCCSKASCAANFTPVSLPSSPRSTDPPVKINPPQCKQPRSSYARR
eukprot:scaffold38621_cov81-Phaeocystis_antarctica.AAC.8